MLVNNPRQSLTEHELDESFVEMYSGVSCHNAAELTILDYLREFVVIASPAT